MKIIHICTFDIGGAAIAAIRLHKALLANGVDSSMLFLNKSDTINTSVYAYVDSRKKNHGILVKNLIQIKNKLLNRKTKQYRNLKKLKNKAEGYEMFSFNPTDFDISSQKIVQDADIIHLHWVSGFVDYKFFKINTKPVVWTLHDMNPFTGGCHYSSQCDKYKSECDNCPQLQGTINTHNALSDQEYKIDNLDNLDNLDNQKITIASPSDWLKACSSESRIFKKFEHKLIRNCVDVSVFKPLNKRFCRDIFNLPQDSKVLLFVSDNLENKRKGFDLLLNAIPRRKIHNIHICAIGEKNNAIQYPSNITFLGRLVDERLLAMAYSAADAIILPSREDNLPNVMLESLSCGTPVIAFPVGGIIDTIKTGFNGILSKEMSSKSLAISINEFITEKYSFDYNEIRAHAILNYSPHTISTKFMDIYIDLLKK